MDLIEKYHLKAEFLLNELKDTHVLSSELYEVDLYHLAELGASVMLTRDNILEGGSFVRCVVKNDLLGSVQMADSTASKGLKYLLYLREYTHFDENGDEKSKMEG